MPLRVAAHRRIIAPTNGVGNMAAGDQLELIGLEEARRRAESVSIYDNDNNKP